MKIYLYFKQYYIAMGKNLAIFLGNKGMKPNTASLLSLVIILPMFYLLYSVIDNLLLFGITMVFAINIKLILNAVDGIIAREKKINTKLGMYLNVGTDIGPDLFIIYLILNKLNVNESITYMILITILLYLLLEFIIIKLYNKQNLFFGGKESRTFFYILILIVTLFKLDFIYLLYFYILILITHNAGFFNEQRKK